MQKAARRFGILVGVIALSACLTGRARADLNGATGGPVTPGDPPYTLGSGWAEFIFYGVGSYTDSYTFTSIGAVDLKVTDAYDSGDQFAVYDNGTFIGDTSTPTLGYNVGGDADAAYASPHVCSAQDLRDLLCQTK